MATDLKHNLTHTLNEICEQDFIADWANQFYQAKKAEGVSTFTLTNYKQQLGHSLSYCDMQVQTHIRKISPNFIRQYLL